MYAYCVTVSSEIDTFHYVGKVLKQEGKQPKTALEVPETEQMLGPSLPE